MSKGQMAKVFAHIIWIRVVAEIISDKAVPHGLRKDKISLMNLKYKVAYHNLISQKMIQSSQEDAFSLLLMD